jgi:hypothetical protein
MVLDEVEGQATRLVEAFTSLDLPRYRELDVDLDDASIVNEQFKRLIVDTLQKSVADIKTTPRQEARLTKAISHLEAEFSLENCGNIMNNVRVYLRSIAGCWP